MVEEDEPFASRNGVTLTPVHLTILAFASLTMIASGLNLPPATIAMVGMWRRIAVILVIGLIAFHFITSAVYRHRERIDAAAQTAEWDKIIALKSKIKKEPTDWENESAHPSHFLTTRDGKPRLFPFPLGKAGGQGLKGELWWEAGNTAHVGHFNQRESPEAKEQLRLEMVAKEKARQKKAEAAVKEYEDTRKKWQKRFANIKLIAGIAVISMFHRTVAAGCLIALLYYIFATEIWKMLQPPEEEEEEPALKRKKVPLTPGMALTYIYEPTANGPQAAGAFPTRAPSHKLTTSLHSGYAS